MKDRYKYHNRIQEYLADMRIDIQAYWATDIHGDWRLVIFYDNQNCVYHDLGDKIILSYSSELEGGV